MPEPLKYQVSNGDVMG